MLVSYSSGGLKHNEIWFPFERPRSDKAVTMILTLTGTDASAASKSAVDHIRLFADSPPGALDAACSGKAKKKCNGSAAPKSSRIEDESSDDSEDERMARIQSVVVDAPPPPPRSKPKAP